MLKKLVLIALFVFLVCVPVYAQDWMPDENLRKAVSEMTGVPIETLTPTYIQLHLTNFVAINKGITDLTGLEYATDLQFLVLPENNISDLSPLSNLTGLVYFNLGTNQITDLSPLSGLVNLEVLGLPNNRIVDVSPLVGLVNLKTLNLNSNQISDISPLSGLANLESLEIYGNSNKVLFTLSVSKLKQFGYDQTCDLDRIPTIIERIGNRNYPSIFGAFGGGRLVNLPNLPWTEAWSYHDLTFSGLLFNSTTWVPSPDGLKHLVHIEAAKAQRAEILSRNPNVIFIVALNYQAANPGDYPDDWPYWLRDESGNIIGEGTNPLIDFTLRAIQDRSHIE